MSESAKKVFDIMRAAKDIGGAVLNSRPVQEIFAKGAQQVERGAAEGASALFTGQAYVLYGHGQQDQSADRQRQHDLGIER